MLRLSRKIEYALIAVQYIASHGGRVVSAKEIAAEFEIPFEFLSKALQQLQKHNFIVSYQGVKGGYVMARDPGAITVADVIYALEGKPAIVDCCSPEGAECKISDSCRIKDPMQYINERITSALESLTIKQIAFPHSMPSHMAIELHQITV